MGASYSRRFSSVLKEVLSSAFIVLLLSESSFITYLFCDCIGQDKPMYSKRYGFINSLVI
jgi:hypothetical protein